MPSTTVPSLALAAQQDVAGLRTHPLVPGTEGATDPETYECIVGARPPTGVP